MSDLNLETFEYDNNRGAIIGSVDVNFYFNDNPKNVKVTFNNAGGGIHIDGATLNDMDFFQFTDSDDWLHYEHLIWEYLEELNADDEPEFHGYGYNQSDVK